MTPDERTALNEAVCKRLGWTADGGTWVRPDPEETDFTSDWNAVYRWIVPAVKEMSVDRKYDFASALSIYHPRDERHSPLRHLYATPEDYCRAFVAVTEVNE